MSKVSPRRLVRDHGRPIGFTSCSLHASGVPSCSGLFGAAGRSWPAPGHEPRVGDCAAIFSIGDGMRRVLAAIAMGTAAGIALFPLYWAVVTSLRPRDADLG